MWERVGKSTFFVPMMEWGGGGSSETIFSKVGHLLNQSYRDKSPSAVHNREQQQCVYGRGKKTVTPALPAICSQGLQKFIMLLFLLLAPIIAIQVAETGTHPCRTLFVVIDFRCSYLNPYHLL